MRLFDRIKKMYDWTPECKNLLDIGCDSGNATQAFAEKAQHAYGIDNNKEAIAYAKKHIKNATFVLGKGETLPFKSDFFDAVVMGDVLEHVEDERKTLSEVHRVMEDEGILILSVPHKGLFRFLDSFNMKFYFPRLYMWWKGTNYNPKTYTIQPWHRHYSLDDLKRLFGKNFEVIKVHRGGFILVPLFWIISDVTKDLFGKRLQWFRNIMTWLSHIEYQIPFGIFGASIIVVAKKL